MNTKYIDKEISVLARMEQLESISQQGLDKLKEFRYLRDLAKGQLLPIDGVSCCNCKKELEDAKEAIKDMQDELNYHNRR